MEIDGKIVGKIGEQLCGKIVLRNCVEKLVEKMGRKIGWKTIVWKIFVE